VATRPHRLRRPPAEALTDSGRARRPSRTRAHRPARGLPALAGRRVRHRLTPTGPGRSRRTMAPKSPIGDAAPHPCRGEALPRPPAPPARRFRVADTSRTTRSADQQSSCIHDRPAVNGRAQSPSRLKPADPHGACTQPIDSGAWAPHSPLQGAWGFSPGLQPRAHGWRRRGKHPWHASTTSPTEPPPCPSPHLGVIPGPGGPAGQAPPDPYATGRSPTMCRHAPDRADATPPCRGEALPRPPAPPARRFRVADTSRTTRSADQPSGCIHDRPAVNGRAQSPSRLKPADPTAPAPSRSTRAPGRLTAPFRGLADSARGFSPGRTAGAHPRWDLHPYPGDGVIPRPWRAGGSGTA
jgi:hypothetical protein